MQRYSPFLVYFNKQTITPDAATLYVRRFVTGPTRNSTIRIIVRGGTIDGKSDIQMSSNTIGDQPFILARNRNQRVTVEATMDNAEPNTAIIPEITPPPKVPDVAMHVRGNLQAAVVDETFPIGQFHLTVSKGVVFNSNQVLLRVEQLVSNKVCASRTITSSYLGDMMNSSRQWRVDDMRLGCQVPGAPNATVVECFVDPRYFTECR
jgi:hypothetical protein